MFDLLSFPHSVHTPHDRKYTEDREVPPLPRVVQAAEFSAIDPDARPCIPVSLPVHKSPQQRQAQVQKLREQLPLHPVNPLSGF